MDAYGHIGMRNFADDCIQCCDHNGFRLILKYGSDSGDMWFQLQLGRVYAEVLSHAEYPIAVQYMTWAGRNCPPFEDDVWSVESGAEWSVDRHDSTEGLRFLEGILPELAPLCPVDSSQDTRLVDSLDMRNRRMPDSPYFLAIVEKLVSTFAA
ncbi:MAG: hypothetical protein V1745_02120 [Patescibacteria group bacterium]